MDKIKWYGQAPRFGSSLAYALPTELAGDRTTIKNRGAITSQRTLQMLKFYRMAGDTEITVVQGDIVAQLDVDVIVNAWNRNIFPFWMLIPRGVSRAVRTAAGSAPFRELAARGPIPLGHAVWTGPGKLPIKGIIHVAGINLLWVASENSVRLSTRNALALAHQHGLRSIAMPIIGSGTGGVAKAVALEIMREEAVKSLFQGRVRIVEFRRSERASPARK